MKIDVVFSGGGVKAFAFIGVLHSMKENNLEIERVAGASAGAILAGLLAANYSVNDIEKIVNSIDLKELLDPPPISKVIPLSKWLLLYYKMGIYKGERLERWIYHQLARKEIYTFRDIKPENLKVVVSDLSLGKLIVIPDDLDRVYGIDPDRFLVAKAIRMSAGYPYFFMPEKITGKTGKKSLLVDGGLLSNYPLWIFDRPDKQNVRPVLGVKLSEDVEHTDPKKIKNVMEMSHALFTTMKQAHDTRYVLTSHKKNTIFIPIKKVETTNFQIEESEKKNLIKLGEVHARSFLKNWP